MKSETKKKKLPNARQQALVKNLAKGMTKTEAARKAGYTKNAPGQAGHQALEQITKTWPGYMESVLGSPEKVIEKYLKPVIEGKQVKVFQNNGRVIYSKPVLQLGARATGLDMYFRVSGAYQDEKKQEQGPVQVIINTNVKLPDPGIVIDVPADSNGHKKTEIPEE